MKIYDYTDDGHYAKMTLVFEDNKAVEIAVISKGRKKDEILKDAYILSKGKEKEEFKGDLSKCENFEMPKPKEIFLDADFNELKGRVYDQYGDEMFKNIIFEVVGTDKARIENKKLIEEEVQEETSYFIVAKCGNLEEKQERKLYPKPEEPKPQPDMTATLFKEVANLKIDAIKDKQINKKLGQEVASLKIQLMQIKGGK